MTYEGSLKSLLGKTIESVKGGEQYDTVFEALFTDGTRLEMFHSQDCCESVQIEEVIGDTQDLIGSPLVECEEVSNDDAPEREFSESHTWTFYRFRTAKGCVVFRWLGESNGYYSEDVNVRVVLAELAKEPTDGNKQ
jgi:hypothetical protein